LEAEFWLEKWESDKLGFHQEKVNSRLRKFWENLGETGGKVFVPLCGKSKDMLWLAGQGQRVFGVEFSEIACRDFFLESKLEYQETQDTRFKYFKGAQIEIWQGDFFLLQPPDFEDVRSVYDRASLIALPESMRRDYAQRLGELLSKGDRILLIGMDYDERKMEGPPFSVTQEEVFDLFGPQFVVELISASFGPEIVGNLRERGLDTLTEKVYVLRKKCGRRDRIRSKVKVHIG